MSRGNARQKIFRDERDYGRFLEGLETTVDKFGFEIFSFVCMPNHIHLFFRTPKPNLSRGMQFKRLIESPKYQDEVPTSRRLTGVPLERVLSRTAEHYGVEVASFACKHIKDTGRDVAAWLARRLTVATLRELMAPFGLTHPDSVRSLINRAEAAMENSPQVRQAVKQLRKSLQTDSSASS